MASAEIEVHRVYCAVTQKVSAEAGSLHPEAAYIVMDHKNKDLGVWVGQNCRQVDRKIAENLGATIKHDEYKKPTAANHIIVSTAPAEPDPFFLNALSVTASQFQSAKRSRSISNDTVSLYEVTTSAPGGEGSALTLVAKKTPHEGSNSKLEFTAFDSSKSFVLECGSSECYLWVGGRVPFKQQKVVKEYVKQTKGSYVYVHEKMESMLFKNKFAHVKEAFDKPSVASSHNSPAHISSGPSLSPIGPEVSRMVDENFGTLKMISNPKAQLGDCLRQGLLMNFANDESGVLTIYSVRVNGSVRTLTERFPDGHGEAEGRHRPVVFSETGAYAAMYLCKNGARGLVYLWVGDMCPPDVQAALALRVKEIIPPGIGADQLQLQQGREPALLLGIIQSKRGGPLCMLRGFQMHDPEVVPGGAARQIKEYKLVLEASQMQIKLINQPAEVVELSDEQSKAVLSPFKSRIAVTIALTPPTAGSPHYTARKIAVTVTHGAHAGDAVRSAAKSVAANIGDLISVQQADAAEVLETQMRKYARSASVSSATDSTSPPTAAHRRTVSDTVSHPIDIGEGKLINIPGNIRPSVSEKTDPNRGGFFYGLRPVRLFQVSHTRRAVGGVFIEEIGIGGVFVQADLSPLDCYLLDGGGATLYAWIGSDCMYPAMALLVRVVRFLTAAMTRVTTPPVAATYGATMIGDFFRLPSTPLEVVYVRQHQEPVVFTQFFKEWKGINREHLGKLKIKNANVQFNPNAILDDESQDAERGDDGRLLSETVVAKPRYSDTVEYKRDVSPVVTTRKSEDFRGVQLKTTPPSTHSFKEKQSPQAVGSPLAPSSLRSSYSPPNSHNRGSSSGQSTPEFVNFRSKLRAAGNSPAVSATSSVDVADDSEATKSSCCCFPFFRANKRKGGGSINRSSDKDILRRSTDTSSSSSFGLQFSQNNKQPLLS